jgi:ABC-type transporter Mla subunit MlaD
MSDTALLYIMAAFVIISAIALCIQAGTLFGIYKAVKLLQQSINPLVPKVEALVPKVEALVPKVDSILVKTNSIIEQSGKQAGDIMTRTTDILDAAKKQMGTVEELVNDAASRAKVQMERVELLLDDTFSRTHETVAVVHDGIMRPLRQVSGVTAGVRAAFSSLSRGNRPTVDRATSDEEMFI